MEEHQPMKMKDAIIAVMLTIAIIAGGGYAVYYFFAPPPTPTLDEVAVWHERSEMEAEMAAIETEEKAAFERECGKGFSGAVCRLKQGACDTALGGFFCVLEGRDGGDTSDIE